MTKRYFEGLVEFKIEDEDFAFTFDPHQDFKNMVIYQPVNNPHVTMYDHRPGVIRLFQNGLAKPDLTDMFNYILNHSHAQITIDAGETTDRDRIPDAVVHLYPTKALKEPRHILWISTDTTALDPQDYQNNWVLVFGRSTQLPPPQIHWSQFELFVHPTEYDLRQDRYQREVLSTDLTIGMLIFLVQLFLGAPLLVAFIFAGCYFAFSYFIRLYIFKE